MVVAHGGTSKAEIRVSGDKYLSHECSIRCYVGIRRYYGLPFFQVNDDSMTIVLFKARDVVHFQTGSSIEIKTCLSEGSTQSCLEDTYHVQTKVLCVVSE
jgi:hypothetical protein